MNCIRQRASAFALVLMFFALSLVFSACQDGGGGGGGGVNPEVNNPPATGGIKVHWPFNGTSSMKTIGGVNSITNAMVTNTVAVNELALTVYSSAGLLIPGTQGRVSATNTPTTLTVPVGTGYSVCALAMPVPGPMAVQIGSGCATGVPVVADPAPPTVVSIFLADNNSDITPSAAGTAAAPNYAYGEQPLITVAVNTITDTAYVADPSLYPYGSALNPGLPVNITSNGASVFVVSDGYPATTTINQFVCNIFPPSGDSCTVSLPGLGADFGIAYSTAQTVRFLARYSADDYLMPSTHPSYNGFMTLWPVASPQFPVSIVDVLSALSYSVNPSPTGVLDVRFR